MSQSRLHLLHLASPALPIGAYAYSQGLEYAIDKGWVDGDALTTWITDGLVLGLGNLDLPILLRVHKAASESDVSTIDHWNDLLLANRETGELLLEDQQVGQALWRLMQALIDDELPSLSQGAGYATAFAVACAHWGIDAREALEAYCFSWLENQVTAATKLVPLGQTAAQRLLLQLLEHVEETCDAAEVLDDENIGLSLVGVAMASGHHERLHTRLFRS